MLCVFVRALNLVVSVTLITGKLFKVMEGEIPESLILTQEQLDELASVFKSVKHFAVLCFILVIDYCDAASR